MTIIGNKMINEILVKERRIEYFNAMVKYFGPRVGRIRGVRLWDRLSFLMKSYSKIYSDCDKEREAGLDISQYRVGYGEAHNKMYRELQCLLNENIDISYDYYNNNNDSIYKRRKNKHKLFLSVITE